MGRGKRLRKRVAWRLFFRLRRTLLIALCAQFVDLFQRLWGEDEFTASVADLLCKGLDPRTPHAPEMTKHCTKMI